MAKRHQITLHFTATAGCWANLVQAFCSIITRQAIHCGSFDTVKQLIAAIRTVIDATTTVAAMAAPVIGRLRLAARGRSADYQAHRRRV